jgi:hypothetical protein
MAHGSRHKAHGTRSLCFAHGTRLKAHGFFVSVSVFLLLMAQGSWLLCFVPGSWHKAHGVFWLAHGFFCFSSTINY